jgi:small subunit ribosomal protein S1
MVVAIDGPAGAGKSTLAGLVSGRLGYLNLNSGNFYRAVTLRVLDDGADPDDPGLVVQAARGLDIRVDGDRYFVGGVDRTDDLHTDRVDRWVARHSAIPELRREINRRLRQIANDRDVVMEGRDITTVVFPDAEVKIYLDASIDARTERRLNQGTSRLDRDEIRKSLSERDHIDRNKPEGKLEIDSRALYLDSSVLTIDEVYEKVLSVIRIRSFTRSSMPAMTEKPANSPETSRTAPLQDELQEQYLKNLDELEEGQLVQGVVVELTADQVFVDVGYKSEGKVALSEFASPPKIGDTVQVVLLKKENRAGELIVSKQKADEKLFWKNLRTAFQDHQPIQGTISKVVKGGFEIALGFEVTAFNPISKIDVRRATEPETYLGMKTNFYIERLYSENRVNVILSRRGWMEEDAAKRKTEFFEKIKVGDDVDGIVKSFTSFGAFIDLGGFDGLLHINDMSWGHAVRPKDYVNKGDTIRVKVIKIDPAEQKINLSLKHFSDDPWQHFEEKYHVGDTVRGTVTKLADFGAFIEVEEGIEGLAHISEFSWVKRIKHPKEMLTPGDQVDVMILAYNLEQNRLSLGLKQVTQNPWDEVASKYPAGMRLTRKVVQITNAGAFIELEDGIDGFLPSEELSWTKKIKNPGSVLKEGEDIEVAVLESDPSNRNIILSVKELSEDPWISLKKAYPERSIIEGEVTNITDFGIFVRVQGGIEGLINKVNLADRPGHDEPEAPVGSDFKVGDIVKAMVIEVSPSRQKLTLSIRDYVRRQQREELKKYIHDEGSESTMTLGDFLKEKDTP